MIKRILGLLVLSLCICTAASAQNDGDFYARYKKFLNHEGIDYHMDEDNDLVFSYKGGNFFISRSTNDWNYLQINMPNLYRLSGGSSERTRVLNALNEVNAQTKVAKGYITSHDAVWLTAEVRLDDSPELEDFFYRLLDHLHAGRNRFNDTMEELSERAEASSSDRYSIDDALAEAWIEAMTGGLY